MARDDESKEPAKGQPKKSRDTSEIEMGRELDAARAIQQAVPYPENVVSQAAQTIPHGPENPPAPPLAGVPPPPPPPSGPSDVGGQTPLRPPALQVYFLRPELDPDRIRRLLKSMKKNAREKQQQQVQGVPLPLMDALLGYLDPFKWDADSAENLAWREYKDGRIDLKELFDRLRTIERGRPEVPRDLLEEDETIRYLRSLIRTRSAVSVGK